MSETADTRSEILDAAYSVLVEEGYDGFTTQAVADEAGRNQSLVHYYFDTRRELLRELVEHSLGSLEDEIRERADDDDPAHRLLTLAEYMIVSTDDATVELKRVLLELRAQAPYDEGVAESMGRDRAFVESFVADVVRDGIDRGTFREVDVEAFAATFVASILGAQTTTAAFGVDDVAASGIDAAGDRRTIEERTLEGLRNVIDAQLRREDG